MRARAPKLQLLPLDPDNQLVIRLWNAMGGIHWDALAILTEFYGVQDVEGMIDSLLTLQDYEQRRRAAAQ